MPPLQLTRKAKAELTRQTKKPSPQKSACRAILYLAEGRSPTWISKKLGVSRASVYNWKRAFEAQGVQGLLIRSHRGRGDRVDATLAERIIELTEEAVAAGEDPSAADIAAMVGVSLSSVYRHWKKAHLRTGRPSPSKPPQKQPKQGPAPTMADVAKAAGTSKTTVSKVLNHAKGVSPGTRERVQKALEDLHYHRHPYMSALMQNWRGNRIHRIQATLAWLVRIVTPAASTDPARQPFGMSHLYRATCAHAEKMGFDVASFRLNDPEVSPKRLCRILKARGVDGLIFANPQPVDYDAVFDEFPSVAFANHQWSAGARVGDDLRPAVMGILKTLWERGYRRTGLVHDEYLSAYTNYQVCSFVDVVGARLLQDTPIPPLSLGNETNYLIRTYLENDSSAKNEPPLSFDHSRWMEEVNWEKILNDLCKQSNWRNGSKQTRRDLIMANVLELWREKFSLDSMITFYRDTKDHLESRGCRIPQDIALVHLNWNEDVESWCGIRRNFELKAQVAVETLATDMAKDRRFISPVHSRLLVPPLWVEGETLPVRKRKGKGNDWPKGFLEFLEPLDTYHPPDA